VQLNARFQRKGSGRDGTGCLLQQNMMVPAGDDPFARDGRVFEPGVQRDCGVAPECGVGQPGEGGGQLVAESEFSCRVTTARYAVRI
jgi:hypothetical protein